MPISNEVELEFRRLLSKADANGRFTETLIDFMNKIYAMGYEEARDEYEMDCDQCSRD